MWGYLRVCCLVTFALFAQPAVSDQADEIIDLLGKASKALQEKNYEGRFTYEFGSTLETLELVHAVKDGLEYERVTHLSGLEREFVRGGRSLDCISPGSFLLRGGLVSSHSGIIGLNQNYRFYLQGEGRVAGRPAILIKLIPKDEYRYGMTLALDEASHIPLMVMTAASSKVALERFQFVELTVGHEIDSEHLKPSALKHAKLDGSMTPCSNRPLQKAHWASAWVPPGFVLSHSNNGQQGESVLTYTDGVASFTLFISPVEAGKALKEGVAVRGSTIALMTSVPHPSQKLSVILVGEVPLATADRVANSVVGTQ